VSDVLNLRKRVEELQSQLEAERAGPPSGTEDLLQGDDSFEVGFSFVARKKIEKFPFHDDKHYTATIEPTWNEIFAGIAPAMINETSDSNLRRALWSHFTAQAIADFEGDKDLKGRELRDFKFKNEDLDTCIVQLRALGLITGSERKRSLRDAGTYWTLTQFGDRQMVILRALRRTPLPPRKVGAKTEGEERDSNLESASPLSGS
jgi:hypothetical protein